MIINRRSVSPASPHFRIDLGPRMAWLAATEKIRRRLFQRFVLHLSLPSIPYPRPWGIIPNANLSELGRLFITRQLASGPISAVQAHLTPSHTQDQHQMFQYADAAKVWIMRPSI
jgi:hypothetical protein